MAKSAKAKRPISAALRAAFKTGLARFDEDSDTKNHVRDVLLIVATLITAVTFQAGVNPPGGVWQEDKKFRNGTVERRAGCAVYSRQTGPFYAFLIFNTLALSTSILVLISLTFKFPFYFEVLVATSSLFATYASSIFAIAPHESVRYRYLLITAIAPFLIRALVVIFRFFVEIFKIQDAEPAKEESGP